MSSFKDLVAAEEKLLGGEAEAQQKFSGEHVDEPWVRFTPRDRFGLAFSGGGIRSASFNLGILQTLARLGWLKHVDYLSTVSGGGYIGGFWSALRREHGEAGAIERLKLNGRDDTSLMPIGRSKKPTFSGTGAVGAAVKVFIDGGRTRETTVAPNGSRAFTVTSPLAQGVHTVRVEIDGKPIETRRSLDVRANGPHELRHLRQFSRFLIPRLGVMRFEMWAGILAIVGGMVPTLALAVSVMLLGSFFFALLVGLSTTAASAAPVSALVGIMVTGLSESRWRSRRGIDLTQECHGLWSGVAALFLGTGGGGLFVLIRDERWPAWNDFIDWSALPDVLRSGASSINAPSPLVTMLFPAAALGLSAALAMLARLVLSRWTRAVTRTLDRQIVWFGRSALLWLLACAVWFAAKRLGHWVDVVGIGGAFSGGASLLLRYLKPSTEPKSSEGKKSLLTPMLVQLLAFVAVLAFVVVGAAVFQQNAKEHLWKMSGISAVVFIFIATLVNTSEVGLQAFYRGRIARAFLGAATADGTPAQTYRREDDDFAISELKGQPIHLVCCTANDVSSDSLQTLGRGGRSVAISPLGISLGNHWQPPKDLKMSELLTASGAAFNSQMGSVSVQFGDALAMLMSAFNLRLGLWVPHPAVRDQRPSFFAPFVDLLNESVGNTNAEPVTNGKANSNRLHLSDGGHFENLGLYELIRRHCRHIIVSDAGADTDLAFDDLGSAIRRIREDFAVEIEIDVAPLKARTQHVVAGTIHFDGLDGSDKGTLLYVKPTLIGTEPQDVRQYADRNSAFPHETTGDQFYDEAQWESYRRLGEYSMAAALRVVASDASTRTSPVDALFLSLRSGWHSAPANNSEVFLKYTERCTALENEMKTAPAWFRAEFFPELRAFGTPAEGRGWDDRAKVLSSLMQAAQLMEDVWLAANLDVYWSHPLNDGWMSYFHRWTNMPTFHTWWPVLRSLYNERFRNFMRDRFNLKLAKSEDATPKEIPVELWNADKIKASDAWKLGAEGMRLPTTASWGLVLALDDAERIPVASLTLEDSDVVTWKASNFQVPPWLLGSGVSVRFLDLVLKRFEKKEIRVELEPLKSRDTGLRTERAQLLAFYKSRGFNYLDEHATQLVRPGN